MKKKGTGIPFRKMAKKKNSRYSVNPTTTRIRRNVEARPEKKRIEASEWTQEKKEKTKENRAMMSNWLIS